MNTTCTEDQLSELAQLVMMIESDQSVQPTPLLCDFCAQNGHHSDTCPYLQGEWEEVQDKGSYYRSNQWSYDQPQHDQWWDNNQVWENNHYQNPYQTWGNNQYQPTPLFQEPYPYPPQQTETPSMSLEDIVKSIATSTQIFQETTQASLKSLEQQITQIAQSLSIVEAQHKLPSEESPCHNACCIPLKDEKTFDGPRVLYEEEEEEVEVEEVVKEEEEIEKADNETIEEVIWVNEREVEPPTTIEKLTPLVDQPQELEAINLSDSLKDTYPKKEDAQPVTYSKAKSKKEELITLMNKYKKEYGWMIAIIKGLSPVWFSRKKKVKYKKRVPMEVWKLKNVDMGQICKVNGHRLKPFNEGFDSNVQDVVHLDAPKC